jgi:hypothetical protein
LILWIAISKRLQARKRLVQKFQEIEAVNWRTSVLPKKIPLTRDEKNVYDRLIETGIIDKHYSDDNGKDIIRVWLDAKRIDEHIAKTKRVLLLMFLPALILLLFLIIYAVLDVFVY